MLSVAVGDTCPNPPRLREASGLGLLLVAQLTKTWGCHPATGGKVVWGVLDTEPPGFRRFAPDSRALG